MAKHSKSFRAQSADLKRKYDQLASVVRSQRGAEITSDLQHVQAAIQLQRARVAEVALVSRPLRLSDCQLAKEDLELFASTWISKHASSVPHDAGVCGVPAPPPLSSDELLKLADNVVWEPSAPQAQPWMVQIAARRERFVSLSWSLSSPCRVPCLCRRALQRLRQCACHVKLLPPRTGAGCSETR